MKTKLLFPSTDAAAVGKPAFINQQQGREPEFCIRELIQNSLDAYTSINTKGGGDNCCHVRFRLSSVETKQIPGIADYESALKQAIEDWTAESGEESEVISYLNGLQEQITEKNKCVLIISDNGIGLDQRSMGAILQEGNPKKPVGSSGSYGLGHLSTFELSNLQYLLYVGKSPEKTIFSGQAVLSSHNNRDKDRKGSCSERGLLVKGINNEDLFGNRFLFYDESDTNAWPLNECKNFPELTTSGSLIIALGFNFFREKETKFKKLIEDAVVCNFAIAIASNKLIVTIELENGEATVIDNKKLASITANRGTVKTTKQPVMLMPTGIDPPQTMQPHRRGNEEKSISEGILLAVENIATYSNCSNRGFLSNKKFDDCEIRLRDNSEKHGVAFWRNGMLVTRTHRGFSKSTFSDYLNFDAIVLLDGSKAKRNSHDLIRKAETAHHDGFIAKKLGKDDKEDLKELLDSIRNWLMAQANKIDFSAIEAVGDIALTGFKRISEDTFTGTSSTVRSPIRKGKKKRRDGKKNEGPESGFTKQSRLFDYQSRQISSTRINIKLMPISDKENVSLRLLMHTGQDPSCTTKIDPRQGTIKKIFVNEKDLTSKLKDNTIPLGTIKSDTPIAITTEFSEPVEHQSLQAQELVGILIKKNKEDVIAVDQKNMRK